jgi:elongation factor 1-beta
MGEVAITFKIMPESPEVDLVAMKETIESQISGLVNQFNIEEKPIAFGLKALFVTVTFPDKVGGITEQIEDKLNNVPNVQSLTTESIGLL